MTCDQHSRYNHFYGVNLLYCEADVGRIRLKSAFEHAQYTQIQSILRMRKVSAGPQIILRMCKVSSGPLLSIHTFCSTCMHWFCKWTVEILIDCVECAGWSGPALSACAWRQVFELRGPYRFTKFWHASFDGGGGGCRLLCSTLP